MILQLLTWSYPIRKSKLVKFPFLSFILSKSLMSKAVLWSRIENTSTLTFSVFWTHTQFLKSETCRTASGIFPLANILPQFLSHLNEDRLSSHFVIKILIISVSSVKSQQFVYKFLSYNSQRLQSPTQFGEMQKLNVCIYYKIMIS